MTTEVRARDPRAREHAEPTEARHPVPLAIIVLVSLSLGWATGYIMGASPDADAAVGDQRSVAIAAPELPLSGASSSQLPDGQALYAAHCAACHQATGAGLPGVFPPLAGSRWVTGDEALLLQIMLHGISGPIEVLGTTYQGTMPPFAGSLDDPEIAAVASFVRSQWGNDASTVQADHVAEARSLTGDRTTPWSGGEELEALDLGR